jgi:hypothetical protein
LEKSSTESKQSPSFLENLIEGLLYALATLLFYIIPFIIPAIVMKKGSMVFFGEIIFLLIGLIVFIIVINRKKFPHKSRKNHR